MMEKYSIEGASHQLCAALHMDGIDPNRIEICLPREAWWRMYTRLEQKFRGVMAFDGRGPLTEQFQYMGVTYRVKE